MREPQECPRCRVTVVPNVDGRCPSCGDRGWEPVVSDEEVERHDLTHELREVRQELVDLRRRHQRQRRKYLVLVCLLWLYILARIWGFVFR